MRAGRLHRAASTLKVAVDFTRHERRFKDIREVDMNWSLVVLGCLGGAIPDLLRVAQNRYQEELPAYISRVNFWVGLLCLVFLGGFTSWAGGAKDPQSALAMGYAAPELVSRLLSGKPVTLGPGGSVLAQIRRWWHF